MTDPKKFEDSLPQDEKRFYSVNFLLARFAPANEEEDRHAERFLGNKLPSRHYQSHDFAVVRFYKQVSTPLSRFLPIAGEDE